MVFKRSKSRLYKSIHDLNYRKEYSILDRLRKSQDDKIKAIYKAQLNYLNEQKTR